MAKNQCDGTGPLAWPWVATSAAVPAWGRLHMLWESRNGYEKKIHHLVRFSTAQETKATSQAVCSNRLIHLTAVTYRAPISSANAFDASLLKRVAHCNNPKHRRIEGISTVRRPSCGKTPFDLKQRQVHRYWSSGLTVDAFSKRSTVD